MCYVVDYDLTMIYLDKDKKFQLLKIEWINKKQQLELDLRWYEVDWIN